MDSGDSPSGSRLRERPSARESSVERELLERAIGSPLPICPRTDGEDQDTTESRKRKAEQPLPQLAKVARSSSLPPTFRKEGDSMVPEPILTPASALRVHQAWEVLDRPIPNRPLSLASRNRETENSLSPSTAYRTNQGVGSDGGARGGVASHWSGISTSPSRQTVSNVRPVNLGKALCH